MSTTYKLYYLEDLKLAKNYAVNPSGKTPMPMPVPAQALGQPKAVDSVQIEMPCPQCGKKHEVSGYMDLTSQGNKEIEP